MRIGLKKVKKEVKNTGLKGYYADRLDIIKELYHLIELIERFPIDKFNWLKEENYTTCRFKDLKIYDEKDEYTDNWLRILAEDDAIWDVWTNGVVVAMGRYIKKREEFLKDK